MDGAFKKISPSNITVTPYNANKQYNISDVSGSGITIYVGEYQSIDQLNFFDKLNDYKTSNDEYRRLIFSNIKLMFYHNYMNEGNIFISSSMYEEYEQTTLFSGSYTTNLRKIGLYSGSSYQGVNNIYNDGILYDSDYVYDNAVFDSQKGNLVTILSIDKDLYGNNVKPYTFSIIDDIYYIRDDGRGNVFDYINEYNFNECIKDNKPGNIYIGNIFYSLGLVVITNQNYICVIDTPPVAVNDYYSYYNTEQPFIFDILNNDFSDCNSIDLSSIQLINIDGFNFPDCYLDSNYILNIIDNQNSYIPGLYKIGYNIKSFKGIESNLGVVSVEVKQRPLKILSYNSKICRGSFGLLSYTINIVGGTPLYSYSFDNITYTTLPTFQSNVVSGNDMPSTSTFVYVKDFTNNIVSKSLTTFYDDVDYSIKTTKSTVCNNSGSINISSSLGISYTIDPDITEYNTNTSYPISVGSYDGLLLDGNGCYTPFSFIIEKNEDITFNYNMNPIKCHGGFSYLNIGNISGGKPPYAVILKSGSTTYYDSSVPLEKSSTSGIKLFSGNYDVTITDSDLCYITQSIIIGQPDLLIMSSTQSLEECSSVLELNAVGGTLPYNYTLITPKTEYIRVSENIFNLYADGIDDYNPNILIEDANGCMISSSINIPGRKYIYDGTYCEKIGKNQINTGFVINPRVKQVYTSGINSGSYVGLFDIEFDFDNDFTSSNKCQGDFEYKTYDPVNCSSPTLTCTPPTLISAEALSCDSNYDYNFTLMANTNKINNGIDYILVEYSLDPNFLNPQSYEYLTSDVNPIYIPVDTEGLGALNKYTPVHFRIKNSCSSSGLPNSDYSQIITKNCPLPEDNNTLTAIFLHRGSSNINACNVQVNDPMNRICEYGVGYNPGDFCGTVYYIDSVNFLTATKMYKNNTGFVFVPSGWYSDGNLSRRWNGTNFVNNIFC